MLTQYEVPGYLANELPEIQPELKSVSTPFSIVKTIQCLANYTRCKVIQNDLKGAKRCFSIAEQVYSQGNALVKNAIENVFVYSFSSLMNMGTKDEKRRLHAIIPVDLYTVYIRQMLKPGL